MWKIIDFSEDFGQKSQEKEKLIEMETKLK